MSALHRWAELVEEVNGRVRVGARGVRDPDFRCEGYRRAEHEPFEDEASRPPDCETDGHYLCSECVFISEKALRRRRGECEECGAKLERMPGAYHVSDVWCPACSE